MSPAYPSRPLFPPRPYQRRGIKRIHYRFGGRALVADDMGLGKTYQALVYAWRFVLPLNPPGPIVIIVPATLKENWRREARKHLGMRVEVLSGMKPPPRSALPSSGRGRVYVLNYDILGAVEDPDAWLHSPDNPKRKKRRRSWGNWLRDLRPALLICDECEYLKSRTAKRTKGVKELCRVSERIVMLSGTPVINRPAELWPVLNMLRPRVFRSFTQFADRYCQPRKTPWGMRYDGATRLDELNAVLKEACMIRRLKEDVLEDLPPVTRQVIPVEVSDPDEYRSAEEDYIRWLVRTAPHMVKKAMKAEQLSRLGGLARLAAKLKLPAVIEFLERFLRDSDEKMIVFGVHKKILRPLARQFADVCVHIDGGTSLRDRDRRFDAFNRKRGGPRLLFGNMIAAGRGWSCVSSSNVTFIELPWTSAEINQATCRIHGLERGLPGIAAMVRFLLAVNTTEEDRAKRIQVKEGILNAMLDGGRREDVLRLHRMLEDDIMRRVKEHRRKRKLARV